MFQYFDVKFYLQNAIRNLEREGNCFFNLFLSAEKYKTIVYKSVQFMCIFWTY